MGSGHPLQDSEATLPPLSALRGQVCPRCHRQLEVEESEQGPVSGPATLPRCPQHGLAYVRGSDLAAAHGDVMLGTTVAGRFTILARLGSGSMGAVYRARQEAVGRDVALKIVRRDRAYDPETKARFEREARATSALVSPHTVTVFDFGEAEDGAWFLAMELLDGETLGQRLARTRRLPVVDAVRVAREALKSLAEAHAKGIVHRDLKPDNLFLVTLPDEAGNPAAQTCKVLDFGIAKVVLSDEQKVDQLETQAGTVFGTPRYMSPEQAQGTQLDARSDLYSLGVILFQMLAGRAPFIDDDAVVVMARHIKEMPPPMREVAPQAMVPPLLERVVRRALSKLPSDRPQSAEQFIAELDAALEGSGAAITGVHVTSWEGPRTPTSQRARRALVAGAGVLGVGLLFSGGYLVVRMFRPSPSAQAAASAAAPAASVPVVVLAPDPGTTLPAEAGVDTSSDAGAEASSARVEKTHRHSTKRSIPRRVVPAHRRAPAPVDLERKAGDKYGRFE